MRLNLKLVLGCLMLAAIFMTFTFWSKCSDVNKQDNNFYRDPNSDNPLLREPQAKVPWAHQLNQVDEDVDGTRNAISYHEIECSINDEYTVGCRREGPEIFLPFSFISKYFEVYGKIAEYDGYDRFEWKHSYSRYYTPKGRYNPEGSLIWFEYYNVEVRDRVKCISGVEGVPISTQWGPEGYFYPIQIAQYGLSHYSKYLAEKQRTINTIENAEDGTTSKWMVPRGQAFVENQVDVMTGSRVIEFSTPDSLDADGVGFHLDTKANFFLSFDFKFASNGSITVTVEPKGKQPTESFFIHYVCSQTLIKVIDNDIYYGIGDRRRWTRITRDITTDFNKGVKLMKRKKKLTLNRVMSITFHGHGWVDNMTLASSAHLAQFYYAANWLVLHQDENGGWPNMVTRKLANGMLELQPGWYSGMAQGQAMSLLIRAYYRTKNRKYLDAALRATSVFEIPSAQGGVLARFMDRYDWYEEYPTTPSCFILNGFMYALIGLYDLKEIAPDEAQHAAKLYKTGIASLKVMLPLFDTGSGSIYDLRHTTLGTAPNLARWDYHTTHINQLLLISTVERDPFFEQTAKRWISYMYGKRAPHN